MNPGVLYHPVTLRFPILSRDGMGAALTSYTSAGRAWAERDPRGAARQFSSEGKQYQTSRVYRIRYHEDLAPGWRLIDGDSAYEVVGVSYVGRNDLMDLECRTIEDTEDNNVVNFSIYHTSANSAGNTTVTVEALCLSHTEMTTFTGAGSTTRVMVLATSSRLLAGARLTHRLTMPATAAILIEWRNATSGGALITSYESDGSGDDVVAEFVWTGAAWSFVRFNAPANA